LDDSGKTDATQLAGWAMVALQMDWRSLIQQANETEKMWQPAARYWPR
jgi:hypothetical protein